MKKEFNAQPNSFKETWPGELDMFSWKDFLAGVPSVLFLVTGWKSNGKENACLQAWSTFTSDRGEFICIIGHVQKGGHMYQSLKKTGCCVLNFPTKEISDKCFATIEHNHFEADEITASGLTAEKAYAVNAPRIKECFLNIECEYLWEHEVSPGSTAVTVALRSVHICMDSDYYDQSKLGRYGETGFLFNINSPRNPDTGAVDGYSLGVMGLINSKGIFE
jgi:flavin reductase (DIM6/NTAB) family NADH-FMN oxidoreductase RutF